MKTYEKSGGGYKTKHGEYHIRKIDKGYWTYDLYHKDGHQEFSVGENNSSAEAHKHARLALKNHKTNIQEMGVRSHRWPV